MEAVVNREAKPVVVEIRDTTYQAVNLEMTIGAGGRKSIVVKLGKSAHWYDLTVRVRGVEEFTRRFAGRAETGRMGKATPR